MSDEEFIKTFGVCDLIPLRRCMDDCKECQKIWLKEERNGNNKAEREVEKARKETAGEILTEFYKYLPKVGQLPNSLLNDLARMVQELADKYGVEVEE